MTAKSEKIHQFIVRHVAQHPQDLTTFVSSHFGITRQAAHRHIQRLAIEGVLKAQGTKKSVRYHLVATGNSCWLDLKPDVQEDLIFDQQIAPSLEGLPQNVRSICAYGFTEMCNNVIDHSVAKRLFVQVERTAISVTLVVMDDGVGIFNKIKAALNLPDDRAAILELSKGKFTTDSSRHTGQGIFFTSRVFDTFYILSGDSFFAHDPGPEDGDWLLESRPSRPGTRVSMTISTTSERTLKQVFDQFASTDGDYSFSRTHVPLSLAQHENGILVSRSQAKRVLSRFENFEEVWIDFKGIETIGQSFADEIFRVFRAHNPKVKLVWTNASPEVEQMIQRAMSASSGETPGQMSLF